MTAHKNFAQYFDHTLLRQTANAIEIETLCREAIEHSFFSVCVNPCWLSLCQQFLSRSSVKLCTVIGFPLGANSIKSKLDETANALGEGAQEIDCVMNIGYLKSQKTSFIAEELAGMTRLCKGTALVKVIVESGVLSETELHTAIQLVNDSGAEFIKTSSGFASVGATVAAVKMMRTLGRPDLKIKASGGIKTAKDFKTFTSLGASRIGSSQSVAILSELLEAR
ncbi:deoxyribose-phosphate aldolase [bacterium]|nr:deoxyribose-phosphate aldolase [bacterium]